jgi:hypothetical protein
MTSALAACSARRLIPEASELKGWPGGAWAASDFPAESQARLGVGYAATSLTDHKPEADSLDAHPHLAAPGAVTRTVLYRFLPAHVLCGQFHPKTELESGSETPDAGGELTPNDPDEKVGERLPEAIGNSPAPPSCSAKPMGGPPPTRTHPHPAAHMSEP